MEINWSNDSGSHLENNIIISRFQFVPRLWHGAHPNSGSRPRVLASIFWVLGVDILPEIALHLYELLISEKLTNLSYLNGLTLM